MDFEEAMSGRMFADVGLRGSLGVNDGWDVECFGMMSGASGLP